MLVRSVFLLLVSLFFLQGCSQEPAVIVYKGQNYYGRNFTAREEKLAENKAPQKIFKQNKIEQKQDLKQLDSIVIKPGDSLYLIARKNKIPVRSIIEANSLKPPYILYPGDKLYVPKERNTHIVQNGENMSTIASSYGVSVNDLASTNNISNPDVISVGMVLVLPYGAEEIVAEDEQGGGASSKIRSLFSKTIGKVRDVASREDKKSNKDFIYPVRGRVILGFAEQKKSGAKNDGINIAADKGTEVKATAAGKIVYVGNALKGYGNLIIIKHKGNYLSAYAHSDEIYVTKNQNVKQDETIATVGSSGNVSRPQLYFGLRKGKKTLNPLNYLE